MWSYVSGQRILTCTTWIGVHTLSVVVTKMVFFKPIPTFGRQPPFSRVILNLQDLIRNGKHLSARIGIWRTRSWSKMGNPRTRKHLVVTISLHYVTIFIWSQM